MNDGLSRGKDGRKEGRKEQQQQQQQQRTYTWSMSHRVSAKRIILSVMGKHLCIYCRTNGWHNAGTKAINAHYHRLISNVPSSETFLMPLTIGGDLFARPFTIYATERGGVWS
uniref:Uncharacterized protein n=1 Tax=Vespula pensylvanica TaxID=30213 RepID=A0A834U9V2_VESPE|nr:hypothetical protein H0235_007536 [Vespula pensylvanica]